MNFCKDCMFRGKDKKCRITDGYVPRKGTCEHFHISKHKTAKGGK